ncbi:GNAT family N-acetyltransferase [Pontibacillus yanchengensis]|uniref:GNAT family acetyltransferase n=1 Tax=Pontibacillus yanchengensis Y32 TaxID=1385514 RepID=A0A0A2TSH6_9BACI|nr:GNAT family N-acetyltransferase [Pontibacillus yanchengensis]KGP72205.1 GNAT family acetyltransferase [Pontibacillus yanchengensis Y32]
MIWIRNGERKDLPAIHHIENEAILNGNATFDLHEKSIEEKQEWFTKFEGMYPILVAEWEGEVAGYAYLSPFEEKLAYQSTVELSVYVYPRFHGLGIGHSLMTAILDKGKECGFHTVISKITEGNERSVQLHIRYGFSYVGTLKEVGYKFDRWHDVLLYQWFPQEH